MNDEHVLIMKNYKNDDRLEFGYVSDKAKAISENDELASKIAQQFSFKGYVLIAIEIKNKQARYHLMPVDIVNEEWYTFYSLVYVPESRHALNLIEVKQINEKYRVATSAKVEAQIMLAEVAGLSSEVSLTHFYNDPKCTCGGFDIFNCPASVKAGDSLVPKVGVETNLKEQKIGGALYLGVGGEVAASVNIPKAFEGLMEIGGAIMQFNLLTDYWFEPYE